MNSNHLFKSSVPRVMLMLTASTVICASAGAADFPALGKQIDSEIRPFGAGTCSTQRTGVWLADGGVVVAIQRPKQRCTFETLDLVVDGERIPLTTADDSFFRKRISAFETQLEWHKSDSGKVFFQTNRTIDPAKIQGILEPNCQSANCLNEAGASQVK